MWLQHPIILEGEKVRLVPLEESHFGQLNAAGADPRIWEFMPVDWSDNSKTLTDAMQEALRQRDKKMQYPFVVVDKNNGKIFGSTRFMMINEQFKTLEIGWTWYHPDYWGKRYNDECKLLLLTHCFETLGTIRVRLGTLDNNFRSQKAMERIGAKKEGVFRHVLTWNGIKRNAVSYSIIDNEWPETKRNLERLVRS